MFRKKTVSEMNKHPFTILLNEFIDVEEKVDEMIKNMISNRCYFNIESVDLSLLDDEAFLVTLKCRFLEYDWDCENQKVLDTYQEYNFEQSFSYEYFDYEDLPLMIFNTIEKHEFNS